MCVYYIPLYTHSEHMRTHRRRVHIHRVAQFDINDGVLVSLSPLFALTCPYYVYMSVYVCVGVVYLCICVCMYMYVRIPIHKPINFSPFLPTSR